MNPKSKEEIREILKEIQEGIKFLLMTNPKVIIIGDLIFLKSKRFKAKTDWQILLYDIVDWGNCFRKDFE